MAHFDRNAILARVAGDGMKPRALARGEIQIKIKARVAGESGLGPDALSLSTTAVTVRSFPRVYTRGFMLSPSTMA